MILPPFRLMPLSRIFCIAAALLSLRTSCHAQSAAVAPSPDSVAAAAARQLTIGEHWFKSACLQCHATGGLANADFRLKWSGHTAYDLFERIRSTMPASQPGALTQGTYAAIVAYLLQQNGMRSSGRRISSDSTALATIRLTFTADAR
jgi:mono/diheme cytochrome c family protein